MSLGRVVLGDLSSEVEPNARADHADDESRRDSHGRAKSPPGVPAGCRANEREELSHTSLTNAVRGWARTTA